MCGGGNLPDPCDRGGTLPVSLKGPGDVGTAPEERGPGGGGGPNPDDRPAAQREHLRLIKNN